MVFFIDLNLDLVKVDSLSFFLLFNNKRLMCGFGLLRSCVYCDCDAGEPFVGWAVGGNLVFVESFVNTEDAWLPQTVWIIVCKACFRVELFNFVFNFVLL